MNLLRIGLVLNLVLLLMACASTAPKAGGRSADDMQTTAARAEQAYASAEWAAAADAYAVLVKDMPQDTNLWFRYANALARSEQPDKAVSAYAEVLARDARFSKAWFNMGIVQLRQAANSFSRMNANIGADDPLRAQSEQVYGGIMNLLGDESGARPGASAAGGRAKPGPVAPGETRAMPAPGAPDAGGSGGVRP